VLEGADLHEQVRHMIDDTVTAYIAAATSEGYPEEWDLDQLWTALGTLYPVGITVDELVEESGGDRDSLSSEFMVERLREDAQAAYDQREEELGEEATRELERRVVISVLDRKWREHLYEMDYLKEGIGLRSYAQRDPLVEYQREGYDLFAAMMDAIKEESVGFLFHLEVTVDDAPQATSLQTLADADAGAGPIPSIVPPALPTDSEPEQPAQKLPPALLAKGLDVARPSHVEYSAPSLDGDGGVVHRSADGDDDGDIEVDPNANRAERRRQQRAQRKKR
jgi:preprotein translocase subunit SecA